MSGRLSYGEVAHIRGEVGPLDSPSWVDGRREWSFERNQVGFVVLQQVGK